MEKNRSESFSNENNDDNNNNNNNKCTEELAPLNWTIKDIHWKNFLILLVVHVHLPYALYLIFFGCYSSYTFLFAYTFAFVGGFGIGAGNHRYWSHRSFKAKLPLQIIMMLLSTTVFQEDIIFWCRVHRTHHKFTDTDGDPHNSRRGFFYAQTGWLALKEPKIVTEKSKQIDISDLTSDPVLQFQKKYFYTLSLIFCVLIPTFIPTLWGESVWNSFNLCVIFKFCLAINFTSFVNSFAHLYGTQPYDKRISARQSLVANIASYGEGWHNYHHSFPFDYRASEFGGSKEYNLTKWFIDFFAWIGWAYDLQTASEKSIAKRKEKYGSTN